MQQACSKCGYISDRPARFCRNCGAALFVENDATSASTRNYGGQQGPEGSSSRPWASQSYAPGQSSYGSYGEQPPDTARFYRPPAVPDYGAPPQKKSSAKTWLVVALGILLIIGGAFSFIGYSVFTRVRQRARIPSEAVLADIEAQIQDQIRQAEERARRAQENVTVFEGPAPPVPPPPPGEGAPTSLDKYKYPKADIQRTASFIGNEFLQMTTSDSVATVSEFYNKLVGQAAIKTNDANGEKVVFQVRGSPSTLIAISTDEDNPGKTEISVIRSGFNIPKLNIKIN